MKLNELFKNEEVISQVKEMLGDKVEEFENLLDGENVLNMVPYSRFKEVNDAKKTFEAETKNLKTKLTKLSNDENLTPEEFENKKKEIIKEYDLKIKGIEKDFQNYKRDTYINEKLKSANCKYADLIFSKINLDKVELAEDGKTYKFLDEQIEGLKKAYPDMFVTEDTNNNSNNTNRNDGIYNNQVRTNTNVLAEKLGIKI